MTSKNRDLGAMLTGVDELPVRYLPGQANSPLNYYVWRLLIASLLSFIPFVLLQYLPLGNAPWRIWLTAALGGAVCYHTVRFLMVKIKGRLFWLIWLGLALTAILISGNSELGFILAIAMSAVFLVFRQYKPYRHLTSRRRAGIFFIGLGALALLSFGWNLPVHEGSSWLGGLGINLLRFEVGFLRLFWIFSLLNLFLRMRLHFLRLQPKLMVSGLFIALVPMLIVVLLALISGWSILGESRVARGKAIFEEWATVVDRGASGETLHFDNHFAWKGSSPCQGNSYPEWLCGFVDLLEGKIPSTAPVVPQDDSDDDSDSRRLSLVLDGNSAGDTNLMPEVWAPADTTAYFQIGSELWLIRIRQGTGSRGSVRGFQVDEAAMTHLSEMLGAEAFISRNAEDLMLTDFDDSMTMAVIQDSLRQNLSVSGTLTAMAADSGGVFLRKRLPLGGSIPRLIYMGSDRFVTDNAWFKLTLTPACLMRQFDIRQNDFNQVILIMLLILAGLLLLVLLASMILGVRITTGITSAVKTLNRMTKQIAGGDLSSYVEIPSEDELGDLAHSFNEMTVAVKIGQREAVTRERLERELATAREIQERLLPHRAPELPGFEITGLSIPSRQVGGDYFDFLELPGDRLGIAIGDVSGKGIPAALLMSNLQASLQGQVIHPSSVAETVGRVNDLLVRSTDDHMFATFFYCLLDSGSGRLAMTNAGHNPPIHCRANGSMRMLDTGGLLLGMLPGQNYQQEMVQMEPGDVIVLYTDGITEAEGPLVVNDPATTDTDPESPEPEMFGEERLFNVIRGNLTLSADGIKEAILKAMGDFTRGEPQSDDITIVVIKRLR
jgi:serine phosphatase RsbU (regulator of sigma subunit)